MTNFTPATIAPSVLGRYAVAMTSVAAPLSGAGKSTLFALLNGSLHEDGGDFSMPASWQIAQGVQHMPETTESATDFVLSGDERLSRLREQLSKSYQSSSCTLCCPISCCCTPGGTTS